MLQNKNVVTVVILSIVTCGIYGIVWFFNLTDDASKLNNDPEFRDENYNLLGWDVAKHNFDLQDYNKVYVGELNDSKKEDIEILNELFEIFNLHHPEDYHARSLSVGDVVQIIRGNIIKYYYCDMIGWQLILSSMKYSGSSM
mgnify:CR=1 FL=1